MPIDPQHLRLLAEQFAYELNHADAQLLRDAADELERLRAELAPAWYALLLFAARANELPIGERPDDDLWYGIPIRAWKEAARVAAKGGG